MHGIQQASSDRIDPVLNSEPQLQQSVPQLNSPEPQDESGTGNGGETLASSKGGSLASKDIWSGYVDYILKYLGLWKPKPHRNVNLDPLILKVDDYPNGYPRIAALLDSDPNFVIYRQHRFLHHRCLLHLQDELVEYEQKLQDLDAKSYKENLASRRRDDNEKIPKRARLLAMIQSKLDEYDGMLFRTKELLTLGKPTKRNRESYRNYLNKYQSLASADRQFIRYSDDLVALGGNEEDGWFNGVLEDFMKMISVSASQILILYWHRHAHTADMWKQYFFRSKEQRVKTDDKQLTYYAKERIDILARLLLTFFATLWLMSPVFVLYFVTSRGPIKDVIVLVFTMGFAIFLAVFTKGRRHEIFAATVAYCAVLVVFLSNSSISVNIQTSSPDTSNNKTVYDNSQLSALRARFHST